MHMIKQDQSKVHNMDLLWRYYEKNRNFGKAAHVLARLADMHRFERRILGRISASNRYQKRTHQLHFSFLVGSALTSLWSNVWSTLLEPSCLQRAPPVFLHTHLMESSSMSWRKKWRYGRAVWGNHFSGRPFSNCFFLFVSLCVFRCRSRKPW